MGKSKTVGPLVFHGHILYMKYQSPIFQHSGDTQLPRKYCLTGAITLQIINAEWPHFYRNMLLIKHISIPNVKFPV